MKLNFLQIYAALMMLILIIAMFIMDKETPKSIFVLLIAMFFSLIFYYWRQNQSSPNNKKVASLYDFQQSNKRPKVLSGFQAQAKSIFKQINIQNNSHDNQMHLYSRASGYHGPRSISEMKSSVHQFSEQTNILGTYNIQTWRQQFRQVLQSFKNNMNYESGNRQTYVSVLTRLNLKTERLTEVEDIIENFLKDRVSTYCTHTLKIVNEVNKIMERNFGLSISKIPSTNSKQISISELKSLLCFYQQNRTLPSKYKNIAISSNQSFRTQEISLFIGRQSAHKLDTDMEQLIKYWRILAPMNWDSLQIICPYLLVHILQSEFPRSKIMVKTSQTVNTQKKQEMDSFNSTFSSDSQTFMHSLLIQMDEWLSWTSLPQFRNKNYKKITLVFILMLMKRDYVIGHPLLRTIGHFIK